jgi:hypothetical protein
VIKNAATAGGVVVYAGRDPLTGRKRQKTGTAATKAEARQLEARLISQVGAGQHGGTAGKTVADLLEAWFQWRPRCARSRPTPWSTTAATPTRSSCRLGSFDVLSLLYRADQAPAAAAGLSASYARALVTEFQARPLAAVQGNDRDRT